MSIYDILGTVMYEVMLIILTILEVFTIITSILEIMKQRHREIK